MTYTRAFLNLHEAIRSNKSVKESSRRSCSMQSTHQTGDDIVLACLFPSWFLERIYKVASTMGCIAPSSRSSCLAKWPEPCARGAIPAPNRPLAPSVGKHGSNNTLVRVHQSPDGPSIKDNPEPTSRQTGRFPKPLTYADFRLAGSECMVFEEERYACFQ